MKKEYINGLSIVIPTYNRKEELKRLLKSIFKEDVTKLYEVVIVNNCSNYSIEEVIKEFDTEKIRIQNNPFNVRMATNMMNTFLYCMTKWMWIISDDDHIIEGSIKVINEQIEQNKNVGLIKFSTFGIKYGKEQNTYLNSIEELIKYYEKDNFKRKGNFIFLSNGVYNLNTLYPYLGFGFEYSYTYIPFLIPVLFSLKNNLRIKFSEKEIIKYNHPVKDWSQKKIGLGLSTISHIDFNLKPKHKKKLIEFLMILNYKSLFIYLVKNRVLDSREIYYLIFISSFKYYLKPSEKIRFYFYYFSLYFPFTLQRVYLKYKRNE